MFLPVGCELFCGLACIWFPICYFAWTRVIEITIFCKTWAYWYILIFEITGGEDTTPPTIGEATLEQLSLDRVSLTFPGFVDEDTAVNAVILAVHASIAVAMVAAASEVGLGASVPFSLRRVADKVTSAMAWSLSRVENWSRARR